MAAADTSSLIAYMAGEQAPDTAMIDRALAGGSLTLPPAVLSEILSDPHLPEANRELVRLFALLEPLDGYWERVGALRAQLIARRLKARLADALIAQSCIEHDVPLITRDRDFRHFAKHCGLKLA